jgi:3-phosphoshikimate 1-carboxyvinyltransferase
MIEPDGDQVHIRPAGAVAGSVRPVGSKSHTNRAMVCAALADGASTLVGASCSDDTRHMVSAIRNLGVPVAVDDARGSIEVRGCSGMIPADDVALNVADAGTVMRFLTALCALGHGRFELDGSARMRARPIGALVEALRQLGAGFEFGGVVDFPPLTVHARGLPGGHAQFRSPQSSQFVSALLMVAPYAARDVTMLVEGEFPSRPYVDMTMTLMRRMGVEVLAGDDARFIVPAGQRYQADELLIEPDASAATYFWAAAAITGGRVCVEGLGMDSTQGDVAFTAVLERMGCEVESSADGIVVAGPAGGRLRGIDVDLNTMPDTVQTLAVAALFADGPTRIRNVGNLRVKETDRIAALASELTKLGAEVETTSDSLTINPPASLASATIETYNDHRMAMSLALVGLCAPITIRNPQCVSKSYPGFFESLLGLRP